MSLGGVFGLKEAHLAQTKPGGEGVRRKACAMSPGDLGSG